MRACSWGFVLWNCSNYLETFGYLLTKLVILLAINGCIVLQQPHHRGMEWLLSGLILGNYFVVSVIEFTFSQRTSTVCFKLVGFSAFTRPADCQKARWQEPERASYLGVLKTAVSTWRHVESRTVFGLVWIWRANRRHLMVQLLWSLSCIF